MARSGKLQMPALCSWECGPLGRSHLKDHIQEPGRMTHSSTDTTVTVIPLCGGATKPILALVMTLYRWLECSPRDEAQGKGNLELSEFKPEMTDDTREEKTLFGVENTLFSNIIIAFSKKSVNLMEKKKVVIFLHT